MPLPNAREGESVGFSIYPRAIVQATLGDPEASIWSSIKHLCVEDIAHTVLQDSDRYNIQSRHKRQRIAANVRFYINHAAEFYEAAKTCQAHTAPLLYYYAFLNLAKARCEIRYPEFHRSNECYRHGLTWHPDPKRLVRMETECVSISTRGVWHTLWESLLDEQCPAPNPLRLNIASLFSLGIDTAVEYERAFGDEVNLISLVEPQIIANDKTKETWIRFSVYREELKDRGISRNGLLSRITLPGSPYREVRSSSPGLITFELVRQKKFQRYKSHFDLVRREIERMDIFAHVGLEGMEYMLGVAREIPLRMPQIIVLYTLMFWLSSLVRYDPHSVVALRESQFWMVISGFLNQSRLWLLEQFEWEFYKIESLLLRSR